MYLALDLRDLIKGQASKEGLRDIAAEWRPAILCSACHDNPLTPSRRSGREGLEVGRLHGAVATN
eukprot:15096303-Heterocapsa_arctica.AAC.1